jgi:hypothetical protein
MVYVQRLKMIVLKLVNVQKDKLLIVMNQVSAGQSHGLVMVLVIVKINSMVQI